MPNIEANARYNLTPALGIGAMYTHTNADGSVLDASWLHVGRRCLVDQEPGALAQDGKKVLLGLNGAACGAFFIARSLRWADIGAADAPSGFALACGGAVLRLLVQRATKTGEIP
ncbi:hypothetical protein M3I54_11190 [Paraburkholderia sp. CNPSo 3274]|uniref:hypothetical protein n=1 Tax=Paraburkholderia sp. CNPSo 3274 TaxID=2940932 RepID=UPI0020B6C9F7|nr:hypothetical protein [Paraburkholderia sp. CNPSo 3274]MCP3707543.1 hypothetical protein [Paraburkholderia sp. CNPSo 3274]